MHFQRIYSNSSDGVGAAQSTGTLLFASGMFLSDWRYCGFFYRQPSERLEALVAVVQHAGTAVPLVLLVPSLTVLHIIIITCLYQGKRAHK